MIALIAPVLLLADPDIDPDTGHGPEWGKAAPIALLIIALLGVSLFFLIKSMNKQMKKVPASFDPDAVVRNADDAAPHAPTGISTDAPLEPGDRGSRTSSHEGPPTAD